MFSTSLLLLLMASSCVYCYELTQPGSMMVQPGQSLSIQCKTSYSVSSYNTALIRQAAGKSLEWIGHISSGGGTAYNDKLENKFSISRETSSNTITLQGQNLQTEDTAVYYCARLGLHGYFDYWGKGTTVTVTSAQQTAPRSLFPVTQCDTKGERLTIGCLAPGLSSPDATFEWFDPSGNPESTFVQYPAVRSNGLYTTVSHLTIEESSKWKDDKPYKCMVKNAMGSKEIYVPKPVPPKPVRPSSLLLTTPIQAENGTATFVCLARQFSSKTQKFMWNHNKENASDRAGDTILCEKTHTAISTLELSEKQWADTSSVKCEIQLHNGTTLAEAIYTADYQEPKVEIIPPPYKDMLISKSGDLVCTFKSSDGTGGIYWMQNNKNISAVREISNDGTHIVKTTISYKDWTGGTEYVCRAEHGDYALLFKDYKYSREKGKLIVPSVYLLGPPDETQDLMTLSCYVKDFSPKEVVVSWLADDKCVDDLHEYPQNTTSVIGKERFSVYSQLMVSASDWNDGVVFSCRVFHESIDQPVQLISRSIAKSNTNTLVNVSLNVPSTCKAS